MIDDLFGVSLDLSTRSTGIAYWRGNKLDGVNTVPVPRGMSATIMADTIVRDVMIDVGMMQNVIDWIAVEDVYLGSNPRTLIQLSELRGAVLATFGQVNGLDTRVLLARTAEIDAACRIPPRLKRVSRKVHTRAVAEALTAAAGITARLSEDSCDAVCVGVWATGKLLEEAVRYAD